MHRRPTNPSGGAGNGPNEAMALPCQRTGRDPQVKKRHLQTGGQSRGKECLGTMRRLARLSPGVQQSVGVGEALMVISPVL